MTVTHKHDETLDVRGDSCPMNRLKTRLALEELPPRRVLRLHLAGACALRSVPRSLREEGHRVIAVAGGGGGDYTLWVERGAGADAPAPLSTGRER
jgi:TusA-related sulfurtransferase